MTKNILLFLFTSFLWFSCQKDPEIPLPTVTNGEIAPYDPTPYNITYPSWFDVPPLPNIENPLTNTGVTLGRKLFYDPILSGDSSQSCASCHKQVFAFSDGLATSTGIDGVNGNRNAMAIINMAYVQEFFWDGRSPTLEIQALEPVPNPIEMHQTWPDAIAKLQNNPQYLSDFNAAFNTTNFDSSHVAMALSQFMRILISSDAKIDQVMQTSPYNLQLLTPQELLGFNIYNSEQGDCFHCHGLPRMTNNDYHNNALDISFTDLGRSSVTGNPMDDGKFRAPTLRNIELTAPYMHDGRFTTLDEVLDHYNFGLVHSPTVDPLMKNVDQGGLLLENHEIAALKAFLLTFTDSNFVTNPEFSNPF